MHARWPRTHDNLWACSGLEEALEMGIDWSLREGYAWAEDKEHCEEYGRMLQVWCVCVCVSVCVCVCLCVSLCVRVCVEKEGF